MELLEASRRSALREMKKEELQVWREMCAEDKKSDMFYRLEIPSRPLTTLQFNILFKTPLSELVQQRVPNTRGHTFALYIKAMMLQLIQERYLDNRTRRIAAGFIPIPILENADILFDAVVSGVQTVAEHRHTGI